MFSVRELHDYSSRVRNRFAVKLAELPWSQVEKNREASFYSMKNILIHMIDNEDWIVNWVIPGRAKDYTRRKSADYTDMQMILTHLADVTEKTRSYLESAGEDEFRCRVNFALSSGKVFNMSVEECLFQSFTEQLYHIGELIALLWQENVEPPEMQWFWNNPRESGDSST